MPSFAEDLLGMFRDAAELAPRLGVRDEPNQVVSAACAYAEGLACGLLQGGGLSYLVSHADEPRRRMFNYGLQAGISLRSKAEALNPSTRVDERGRHGQD